MLILRDEILVILVGVTRAALDLVLVHGWHD